MTTCMLALWQGPSFAGDRELALAILARTARAAAAAGRRSLFFRSVAMTATICPIWR